MQCLPLTWQDLEVLHILFMMLNAVMWVSLYHASTTDPGFLPRNIPEYDRAIKEVSSTIGIHVRNKIYNPDYKFKRSNNTGN